MELKYIYFKTIDLDDENKVSIKLTKKKRSRKD